MSEALSAEDLKAIRERANHAGGGPWEIFQHGDGSWLIRHYAGGMVAAAGFSNANADFIAHSRTDIPVLLFEIERLKERITDLHGAAEERNAGWQSMTTEIARLSKIEEMAKEQMAHHQNYGDDLPKQTAYWTAK